MKGWLVWSLVVCGGCGSGAKTFCGQKLSAEMTKLECEVRSEQKVHDRGPVGVEVTYHRWPDSDLTEVAKLAELEELSIPLTRVTDLRPIASLTKLRRLNIASNDVRDLTPLSALRDLELLNLYETPVTDLSPLSSLANLRQLTLAGSSVSDLSPLESLAKLEYVSVFDTPVSDEAVAKLRSARPDLRIRRTVDEAGP